ncbi:hypothetical protein CFP71_28050 [Amycolatopsis thailandensis]|uniref:Uncharacterized protein n=1 Tax=Amycolatopsis thailandensis TaxID=589330 RepID=A0A229RUG9_9PSEU|nr:hypothetical protein CFP71_28050 [Amycolatopsis thailandensis]
MIRSAPPTASSSHGMAHDSATHLPSPTPASPPLNAEPFPFTAAYPTRSAPWSPWPQRSRPLSATTPRSGNRLISATIVSITVWPDTTLLSVDARQFPQSRIHVQLDEGLEVDDLAIANNDDG